MVEDAKGVTFLFTFESTQTLEGRNTAEKTTPHNQTGQLFSNRLSIHLLTPIMVASELKIADKWDHAIETGIKRTAYGVLAGGVVAALLFRGVGMRSAAVGIGAGFGVGMTYADTKREFELIVPKKGEDEIKVVERKNV